MRSWLLRRRLMFGLGFVRPRRLLSEETGYDELDSGADKSAECAEEDGKGDDDPDGVFDGHNLDGFTEDHTGDAEDLGLIAGLDGRAQQKGGSGLCRRV